jgi:hypothetical protein
LELEKLTLEVGAARAGLKPVVPRAVQGESGVVHSFNLLFSDGDRFYAFDIYDSVSTTEMVKSYAKKLDTGCSLVVVCPLERADDDARQLAASYEIRIISPEAAATFFSLERPPSTRRSG